MTGERIAILLLLGTLGLFQPVTAAPATAGDGPLLLAQVSTLYGRQEARRIEIEIKPGSESKAIPIKTERVFPVAIFGSATLDVTLVNPRTVRISAADKKLVGRADTRTCRRQDINGDSFQDLVCDVKTAVFRLDLGELEVTLVAETYNREPLRAEYTILIVEG